MSKLSKFVKKVKKKAGKVLKSATLVNTAIAHPLKVSKGKVKLTKKAHLAIKKSLGNKAANLAEGAVGLGAAAVVGAGGAAAVSGIGSQVSSAFQTQGGTGVFGSLQNTIGDIQDAIHQGTDLYQQGQSTYDELAGQFGFGGGGGGGGGGSGGPSADGTAAEPSSGGTSIMPYVLIGGAVLAALLLLRK
jgi:hypothetical protein